VTGGSLALGRPVQLAYAVPDAATAAVRWAEQFGAGPFFVRRHIPLVDVVHRGRPADFDHTSAYGQWGDVMVELIQDHGNRPSVVGDVFPPGTSGLHHLAFILDDVDATIRRLLAAGHELAMSARTPGGVEFHFVDTVATLGHMLELYPSSERLLAFYAMVADAARDWDGADPVRAL
jgi:catechol 2,3-dioxygenase-like lactoylglutathione lyase family enzyme